MKNPASALVQCLAVLLSVTALSGVALTGQRALLPIPENVASVPLFDMHFHLDGDLNDDGVYDRKAADVVIGLQSDGHRGAVLLGPPVNYLGDTAQVAVERAAPGFTYAFAPVALNTGGQACGDETVRTTAATIDAQLSTGRVYGVGEFSIRRRAPSMTCISPLDRQVLDIVGTAARHGVPVIMHFEPFDFNRSRPAQACLRDLRVSDPAALSEFESLLRYRFFSPDGLGKQAKIIWAHAGDIDPDTLLGLMRAHSNLYADISTRTRLWCRGYSFDAQAILNPMGIVNPRWKNVLESYPDRFFFGSDVNADRGTAGRRTTRYDDIGTVYLDAYRLLKQLNALAAQSIACHNAQILFPRVRC